MRIESYCSFAHYPHSLNPYAHDRHGEDCLWCVPLAYSIHMHNTHTALVPMLMTNMVSTTFDAWLVALSSAIRLCSVWSLPCILKSSHYNQYMCARVCVCVCVCVQMFEEHDEDVQVAEAAEAPATRGERERERERERELKC